MVLLADYISAGFLEPSSNRGDAGRGIGVMFHFSDIHQVADLALNISIAFALSLHNIRASRPESVEHLYSSEGTKYWNVSNPALATVGQRLLTATPRTTAISLEAVATVITREHTTRKGPSTMKDLPPESTFLLKSIFKAFQLPPWPR